MVLMPLPPPPDLFSAPLASLLLPRAHPRRNCLTIIDPVLSGRLGVVGGPSGSRRADLLRVLLPILRASGPFAFPAAGGATVFGRLVYTKTRQWNNVKTFTDLLFISACYYRKQQNGQTQARERLGQHR